MTTGPAPGREGPRNNLYRGTARHQSKRPWPQVDVLLALVLALARARVTVPADRPQLCAGGELRAARRRGLRALLGEGHVVGGDGPRSAGLLLDGCLSSKRNRRAAGPNLERAGLRQVLHHRAGLGPGFGNLRVGGCSGDRRFGGLPIVAGAGLAPWHPARRSTAPRARRPDRGAITWSRRRACPGICPRGGTCGRAACWCRA